MKRMISSRFTFFYRFVVPLMFFAIGLYGLLSTIIKFPSLPAEDVLIGLVLSVISCLIGLAFFLSKRSLKRVGIDDKYLYVSDYSKELMIPLSALVEAKESELTLFSLSRFPFRKITIYLGAPCEFGSKIVFGTRIALIRRPEVLELLNDVIVSETSSKKGYTINDR
jgi:hypothetical protein